MFILFPRGGGGDEYCRGGPSCQHKVPLTLFLEQLRRYYTTPLICRRRAHDPFCLFFPENKTKQKKKWK